jgi:hypothetical protein
LYPGLFVHASCELLVSARGEIIMHRQMPFGNAAAGSQPAAIQPEKDDIAMWHSARGFYQQDEVYAHQEASARRADHRGRVNQAAATTETSGATSSAATCLKDKEVELHDV